jgi:hypothetical protein
MSRAPQNQSDREATRARLKIWDHASPALEEQRWRELMALTDEKALALTKALFSRKLDYIPARPSSGLVEQQALFHRRREK